jgi:importin-4
MCSQVGGLARVIGPNFGPFFDTFLPLLLAKCSSKKSPAERQMAMGAMAEVLQAMGSAGAKYVPAMLPAVRKGLKDSDRCAHSYQWQQQCRAI